MKYTDKKYYYSPQRPPVAAPPQSHRIQKRMMFVIGLFVFVTAVLAAFATTSVGRSVVVKAKQAVTGTGGVTTATASNRLLTTLPQTLAGVMAGKSSNVDVAAYDSKTGQTIHYTNAGGTYNTASIMKVSILEEVLLQDQAEGTGITDNQLSYATPMIENSDNDAATALWQQVGEGSAMQGFFTQVGATSTTVNPAGHWGLTQTTALDQVKILNQFAYPTSSLLNTASIGTITSLLGNVESDQQWGASGGVPSTATVLVKDGWLDDTNGWDVNSIGHVISGSTDYTVAILSDKNTTEQSGIDTITTLSSDIYSALAKA